MPIYFVQNEQHLSEKRMTELAKSMTEPSFLLRQAQFQTYLQDLHRDEFFEKAPIEQDEIAILIEEIGDCSGFWSAGLNPCLGIVFEGSLTVFESDESLSTQNFKVFYHHSGYSKPLPKKRRQQKAVLAELANTMFRFAMNKLAVKSGFKDEERKICVEKLTVFGCEKLESGVGQVSGNREFFDLLKDHIFSLDHGVAKNIFINKKLQRNFLLLPEVSEDAIDLYITESSIVVHKHNGLPAIEKFLPKKMTQPIDLTPLLSHVPKKEQENHSAQSKSFTSDIRKRMRFR